MFCSVQRDGNLLLTCLNVVKLNIAGSGKTCEVKNAGVISIKAEIRILNADFKYKKYMRSSFRLGLNSFVSTAELLTLPFKSYM